MRNNLGFTLVEAVVVAVLVAILAAVAIPIYTGYVQQNREESVTNLAETAAAAADIYYRKTGADPEVDDLNLRYSAEKYAVKVAPPDIVVAMHGTSIVKNVPYRK